MCKYVHHISYMRAPILLSKIIILKYKKRTKSRFLIFRFNSYSIKKTYILYLAYKKIKFIF